MMTLRKRHILPLNPAQGIAELETESMTAHQGQEQSAGEAVG